MGIPRLTSHLRPYAEMVSPLRDQDVVIDGPSFAYHIFHLCSSLRPHFQNPFEAAPTYQELGQAVILWLDFLKSHHIRIKKVFFDGFLPPSKHEVRIARLKKMTRQLSTYSTSHQPVLLCSKKIAVRDLTAIFLLPQGDISSKIPAATFLVPAVIEALRHSDEYASLVQVVPDEADTFCAGHVREHGGLILTGDSDLLVHDLGPRGSVVFFQDLQIMETSPGYYDLKCLQYQPSVIAKRLEILTLKSLGFAVSTDPHASFAKSLQRSKSKDYVSKRAHSYEAFLRDYDAPTVISKPSSTDLHSSQTLRILQMLCPRLSEFILQFPYFSSIAWSSLNLLANRNINPSITHPNTREIFLPFILDSPSRTSAWGLTTATRLTAYSLLNIVVPESQHLETVMERHRQETGSNGREWMLPNSAQLHQALRTMLDVFGQLQEALGPKTTGRKDGIALWRSYATYLDLEKAKNEGTIALGESEYRRHHNCSETDGKNKVAWTTIHHIAQSQASYYSLRILQHILDLVLSLMTTSSENNSLGIESCSNSSTSTGTPGWREILGNLQIQLANLPPLASFPGFNEERTKVGDRDMGLTLKAVKGILGMEDTLDELEITEATVNGHSGKKKKKRRKKRVERRRGEGTDVAGPSDNSFEALMMVP